MFVDEQNLPDSMGSLNHPNMDLEHVLLYRGSIRTSDQSHVQSLLRNDRFLDWVNDENPDLILVNANLRSTGMENLSAVSIFCANFITSLLTIRPEDIVVHFFCGFHNILEEGFYPGPVGLIRSLILQLSLKLERGHGLKLDFINNRDYAEALRDHHLDILCDTLRHLLYQFPPDTQVYCIIDTLPLFDTHMMYNDLAVVLDCLGDLVNDRNMPPFFKVMLTSPAFFSMKINYLPVFQRSPGRVITLSSDSLMPEGLEDFGMSRHLQLSRSLSPAISLAERERIGGRHRGPPIYEDNQHYDYDERYEYHDRYDYEEGYGYGGGYGYDEGYEE